MGNPRIGAGLLPGTPAVKPGDEVPDSMPDTTEMYGFDVKHLMEPQGVAPDPPKCILERLRKEDKVWRWLSEPMCRRHTMRMYEAVSPNARERQLIDSGKDAPPGVRVDEQNRIKWLDDTFLGAIPRRLFLARQAIKGQRIVDLTKKSRNTEAIKEAARMAGAKITDFGVQQWEADELDEKEPS